AFQAFARGSGTQLFFNLDPRVLDSADYRAERTRELLDRHGMDAASLCFELSESHALTPETSPERMLAAYRRQGYRLALDDFGIGYSGLKLLYDQQPDIVKIDRHFIAGIDTDSKKRMMVSAVVQMAKVLGILVVAEGVETEREYRVCRELGCDLVQGFLIARPGLEPPSLGAYETARAIVRSDRRRPAGDRHLVREEMAAVPTIRLDATMAEVFEVFRRNKTQTFFPVVDGADRPIGIVREHDLKDFIYSRYGRDLLSNKASGKRLAHFISRCPIAEIDSPAERILSAYSLADDPAGVVVVDQQRYAGVLTAASLLRIINEKNLAVARDQNPLTKLPGNNSITDWVAAALEGDGDTALAYIDLDNFKPFNDTYGFRQGDRVILLFADLMRQHLGWPDVLLGHVGGDDFFAGFRGPSAERVVRAIDTLLTAFARDVESFYDAEVRRTGGIVARDREGRERRFGLVTASAAVVTLPTGAARPSVEDLGRFIATLKREAKTAGGGQAAWATLAR
ncbi:MAG: EAL domain-containing protein, partial [Alphaproteobacteria bacterium]|nr:EAL domain-containing protein [Alphaproteobacteria bacterium]